MELGSALSWQVILPRKMAFWLIPSPIKFNSQNIIVLGQTFKSAYFNRVLELVTHENTIYLSEILKTNLKLVTRGGPSTHLGMVFYSIK